MTYRVRSYDNNGDCSLGLNTRPLVSFVESNFDDVLKTFALLSNQHRSISLNKIIRMLTPFAGALTELFYALIRLFLLRENTRKGEALLALV